MTSLRHLSIIGQASVCQSGTSNETACYPPPDRIGDSGTVLPDTMPCCDRAPAENLQDGAYPDIDTGQLPVLLQFNDASCRLNSDNSLVNLSRASVFAAVAVRASSCLALFCNSARRLFATRFPLTSRVSSFARARALYPATRDSNAAPDFDLQRATSSRCLKL